MTMRIMHGINIKEIPMEMLILHERQAMRNHGGQSLQRLNERGGIDPAEALCILQDLNWRELKVPLTQCEKDLIELVRKYKENK